MAAARNFEYAFSMLGEVAPPIIRKLPVAASQTLVAGDAVVMSSGKVAKAGGGAGTIVGVMAQASASATAGTLVEVQICHRAQVWRAVATADATSVVLNGTATYDLTSAQLVDVADTTGGSLQVIGLQDGSTTEIYIQFRTCFFG